MFMSNTHPDYIAYLSKVGERVGARALVAVLQPVTTAFGEVEQTEGDDDADEPAIGREGEVCQRCHHNGEERCQEPIERRHVGKERWFFGHKLLCFAIE